MARPVPTARNLTLTEELEKLEQSITLTLQEIDHNFSKAHRIVTTSILPVVEQYGEHSRAVWEASKFWKQFFEASANVSLSGYEELAEDEDEHDETAASGGDETTVQDATATGYDATTTPRAGQDATATAHGDDSLLDDGDLSGSTPRPPTTKTLRPQVFADLESPYEAMKREMRAEAAGGSDNDGEEGDEEDGEEDSTALLQQHTARLPDLSMTPRSSLAPDPFVQSTTRPKDPLLHRVLDKNYRLQATPHKGAGAGRQRLVSPVRRAQQAQQQTQPAWADSPASSPIMAVPTLRSAAFMSPVKAGGRHQQLQQPPRTPGVSVNTPGAKARKTRDVFGGEDGDGEGATAGRKQQRFEIDWESDSDDDLGGLYGGMSPPKTIQFALPPSKLLQTPAREASKRIVENILLTAGAEAESSEYSPTMVKMNEDIMNESF